MWLSRLELNTRDRRVQRDLANCHDLHRTLLSVWPDRKLGTGAREAVALLYRVEPRRAGEPQILLAQSAERPDWTRLPDGYVRGPVASKRVDDLYRRLAAGDRLRFRLRANPTRFIRSEKRPNGQRVDLRRESDKVAWFERQATAHGFAVDRVADRLNLAVRPTETFVGVKSGDDVRRITIATTLFEGVLVVTDAERFRAALAHGIGRAKAYGCGLLSVAPA